MNIMRNLFTFYYALKDYRTPWYAKLTALLSLLYLLSPADILPDIIPIAGYIDDLVIVPFLINISGRLLPAEVQRSAAEKARQNRKKLWLLASLAIIAVLAVMTLLFLLGKELYEYLKTAWA